MPIKAFIRWQCLYIKAGSFYYCHFLVASRNPAERNLKCLLGLGMALSFHSRELTRGLSPEHELVQQQVPPYIPWSEGAYLFHTHL